MTGDSLPDLMPTGEESGDRRSTSNSNSPLPSLRPTECANEHKQETTVHSQSVILRHSHAPSPQETGFSLRPANCDCRDEHEHDERQASHDHIKGSTGRLPKHFLLVSIWRVRHTNSIFPDVSSPDGSLAVALPLRTVFAAISPSQAPDPLLMDSVRRLLDVVASVRRFSRPFPLGQIRRELRVRLNAGKLGRYPTVHKKWINSVYISVKKGPTQQTLQNALNGDVAGYLLHAYGTTKIRKCAQRLRKSHVLKCYCTEQLVDHEENQRRAYRARMVTPEGIDWKSKHSRSRDRMEYIPVGIVGEGLNGQRQEEEQGNADTDIVMGGMSGEEEAVSREEPSIPLLTVTSPEGVTQYLRENVWWPPRVDENAWLIRPNYQAYDDGSLRPPTHLSVMPDMKRFGRKRRVAQQA